MGNHARSFGNFSLGFVQKELAKEAIPEERPTIVGAWRSLVARYTGGVEAVGSNPAAPTMFASVFLSPNGRDIDTATANADSQEWSH